MQRNLLRNYLLSSALLGLSALQVQAITITVTNSDDSGPGSLRQAVADAAAGDVIVFDPSTDGTPIVLTSGEIEIALPLTISGNDSANTVISGAGSSRIFRIAGAGTVMLEGLKLTQGMSATDGGALWIDASMVTLTATTVSNSMAGMRGGGIYKTAGTLTLVGSWIHGNTAGGNAATEGGGGIYNDGGDVLSNSATMIHHNTATGTSGSGGGIFNNSGGMLNLTNTTVSGNSATRAGGGIEQNAAVSNMVLTDVTLISNTTGSNPGNGGGIHITGPGSASLMDCTISDNTAAAEGGGLWNGTGTMTINACRIMDNHANGSVDPAGAPNGVLDLQGGGGIFNNLGTVDILNTEGATIITGNTAGGAPFGSGGGILSVGGFFTAKGATISMNETVRAGGGIENAASAMSISSCILMFNDCSIGGSIATASPGNGGAVHVSGAGSMMIVACSVDGNSAGNEGGGLWGSGTGTMMVSRTTVRNNDALDGGGVFLQAGSGTIDIDHSTISTNLGSANGGGLRIEGGTVNVESSTVANNASANGGGVDIAMGGFNSNSNIIADNTAAIGPDVKGVLTSVNYTLVENGAGATGITNGINGNVVGTDPMLQPLAANGGLTLTHALICGSAAIGTGDPADTSNDQREVPVFGIRRDMGAYEVDVECPPAPCTENLNLAIVLDAAGSETTWELLDAADEVVASGGPYADGQAGSTVNEAICVPAGCYHLIVRDAGGNGIMNGGYVLTDDEDRRVIDAGRGSFSDVSEMLVFNSPRNVCVPLGPSRMLVGTCDKPSRLITAPVYASDYGPNATDYEFLMFDPHGTYYRKVTMPMPKFFPANLNTLPVPVNVPLNICVRVRENGVWLPFGPVCRYYFVPNPGSMSGTTRSSIFDEGPGIALMLYPNPNRTGIVNISIAGDVEESTPIGIDVVDAMGRIVHQERLSGTGYDINHVMDLQGGLSAGLYLVNITVNDQRYTQRLVLE